MNISIFGLGYVGCITSGCLANNGHNVVGVDINDTKVEQINQGKCPVEEEGLPAMIARAVEAGRLSATTKGSTAVLESEVSFISVGTPLDDSRISMSNLYSVMDSIKRGIEDKSKHTIVIRSTVLPGTCDNLRTYLSEKIDDSSDVEFIVNPEFLREGCAIDDFHNPPYIILGGRSSPAMKRIGSIYRDIGIEADIHYVGEREAEMLKIANNTFHALKISFANEIGSIASKYDVDGKALMDLVCEDTKLNISDSYLEPGMAFGGSCLPKDSQTLGGLAEKKDVYAPVIGNIGRSNTQHLNRIAEEAKVSTGNSVGIIGLSFKKGTNDMRNSPALRLIEYLSRRQINIYDKNVDLDKTIGSNREYIDYILNEYEPKVFSNPIDFLESSEILIFTKNDEYPEILANLGSQTVIDPVGVISHEDVVEEYRTVSW